MKRTNPLYMAKPFFLLLLLLVGLSLPIGAAAASIPEPTTLFYVNDYADVLEQSTIDHIVETNDKLYADTGAQIVVTTVDFLDGMSADDYIYEMFNQWGIGSAERNNGILLLLIVGEEDYRILQGQGLESTLPSSDLDDMLWEYLEPDFAVADYDAGVQKIFDALCLRINKIYGSSGTVADPGYAETLPVYPEPEPHNSYEPGIVNASHFIGRFIPIIVLFVVIAVACSLRSVTRRRRYRTPPPGGFYPHSHYRPRSYYHHAPPPPRRTPPPPPFGGGFGGNSFHTPPRKSGGGSFGFGGFSGGSRSGGGGSSRGFSGGSRSSSSSRSFSGGSRSGGGGASRGGGAGRRR